MTILKNVIEVELIRVRSVYCSMGYDGWWIGGLNMFTILEKLFLNMFTTNINGNFNEFIFVEI